VKKLLFCLVALFAATTCVGTPAAESSNKPRYLVKDDYHADPAAHVFNGKVYIYPSHDRNSSASGNNGESYDMVDYHVFSLDDVFYGEVTDHGVVLKLEDIPWASAQLWDNDVAHKNGKYYMYFPAKDKSGLFRIGVAIADRPEGPFVPQKEPIRGSYSIDPCVFEDNGNYYMYFGGLWGGQLERYNKKKGAGDPSQVVKLSDDMLQFSEEPRDVIILGKGGASIGVQRFFEASWMHKYNDKYYFSYSTGDTHNICYAIGDNPYGPFTYQGIIMTEVPGWTTHHSIVEFNGNWYLFYHDAGPSGGTSHLRSMKVAELTYLPDGTISRIRNK